MYEHKSRLNWASSSSSSDDDEYDDDEYDDDDEHDDDVQDDAEAHKVDTLMLIGAPTRVTHGSQQSATPQRARRRYVGGVRRRATRGRAGGRRFDARFAGRDGCSTATIVGCNAGCGCAAGDG